MIIDIDDGVILKGRSRRAGLEGYTTANYSFAVDMCEDDSLANSLLFPKYLIFRIHQPLLP